MYEKDDVTNVFGMHSRNSCWEDCFCKSSELSPKQVWKIMWSEHREEYHQGGWSVIRWEPLQTCFCSSREEVVKASERLRPIPDNFWDEEA